MVGQTKVSGRKKKIMKTQKQTLADNGYAYEWWNSISTLAPP